MEEGLTFEEYAAGGWAALFRFASVLTGDRGLAEDVIQEVLIRVHRGWPSVQLLEQRDAYVRRMVVNEYLSWRRKWSRLSPMPNERLPSSSEPDPAERHATQDNLRGQLALLPRQQRAAVVLRFYEGLTDPEIATIMGCRAVTVRGYISRALRTLRISLDPAAEAHRPSPVIIEREAL